MKKRSKSQPISKRMVWDGFLQVKQNRGGSGVDKVSLSKYEENLENNLYKLWNRMSSGSYFPPPVKEVRIKKSDGSERILGVPTVEDRIAQTVAKQHLEPYLEKIFHPNSFGYRPGRSAHDAVDQARNNCWQYSWVIDLDIKRFFDTLNHGILRRLLEKHNPENWVLMYVNRWLEAPLQKADGTIEARLQGTPQGGVISPLLANLYLHYALDKWMLECLPGLPFERYADDVIIHCKTFKQAQFVLNQVEKRLKEFKLELHPDKTRIAYCKNSNRKEKYEVVSFDFLGFTFKPRKAVSKKGDVFTSFGPGISRKSRSRFFSKLRTFNIRKRTGSEPEDLAAELNPFVRGFHNYFQRYRPSELSKLYAKLNLQLVKWATRTYKRFKSSRRKARKWLGLLYEANPNLFVHWQIGNSPRLKGKSRMS